MGKGLPKCRKQRDEGIEAGGRMQVRDMAKAEAAGLEGTGFLLVG